MQWTSVGFKRVSKVFQCVLRGFRVSPKISKGVIVGLGDASGSVREGDTKRGLKAFQEERVPEV